jgi:DNA-binding GntR family transcriptional regulator
VSSDPDSHDFFHPTRAETIASALRRAILAGDYAPGARLRQAAIATRFGVSTTPVREAFTALAREGLVRQDPHRGVVVFEPSVDELNEIYEMRAVLEPLATEIAAPVLSAAGLAALGELVAEMRTASPERYAVLNHEFHTQIYSAAQRPRLVDIISTLREASASYLRLTVRFPDEVYRGRVQDEHEAILDALRARAAKRAGKLCGAHLKHNQKHVAQLVRDNR